MTKPDLGDGTEATRNSVPPRSGGEFTKKETAMTKFETPTSPET